MPDGNGTEPIFGIQQPQIASILAHFWPDEYRLCQFSELVASITPKLHRLLAIHSTLPLVTASVALPLYGSKWKRTIDIQRDVINGSPHSSVIADTQMFDALPAVLAEKFAKNKDSFYLSLAKALSFRKQTVYGLQGFKVESQEDSHTKNLEWRVTSKNGPENEPPQTPPEPKTQNGSTSGFSNTNKTDAVVCGGSNPLGYQKNSEKPETEVHSNRNSTHGNVFTEAQVVQTTANHRSPQNGYVSKVPLDSMASGLMALSEQPRESPVCGGSFSSADSDEMNSSPSHRQHTIDVPVPDVQHQSVSVGDFMALGKRLGYPAVSDLDLKAGMMGWNGFSLTQVTNGGCDELLHSQLVISSTTH